MTMIAINLPDGAFSALRKDPREMEAELRLAAVANTSWGSSRRNGGPRSPD